MSKTTKKLIRKFRSKMRRVIDLHCTACGFDSEVQKALAAEAGLEVWLEDEIEKLVEAINPSVDHFKVNCKLVEKGLEVAP